MTDYDSGVSSWRDSVLRRILNPAGVERIEFVTVSRKSSSSLGDKEPAFLFHITLLFQKNFNNFKP